MCESLGLLRAETPVINGRLDVVSPLETGEHLAASMPAAELKIIDDAGHGPPVTRATEVAELESTKQTLGNTQQALSALRFRFDAVAPPHAAKGPPIARPNACMDERNGHAAGCAPTARRMPIICQDQVGKSP